MLSGGKQVILVVDDEEQLRKLKRMLLERAGYFVLVAANGPEALAISHGYSGEIHLLVSDIEMHGMSGLDLARQMTAERPGVRVLLNSGNPGYAEGIGFPFLAKPFLPSQLQDAVTQLLSSRDGGPVLHPYSEEPSIAPAPPTLVETIRPRKWRPWLLRQSAAYWAAASIIVLAVPLGLYQFRSRSSPPDTVNLYVTRGPVNFAAAPRRPLILNLDISGLPRQVSYQIEILTEAGQVIAASRAPAHGSIVSVTSPGLPSGVYFVRLYDPSRTLLREFALQVRGKQAAAPWPRRSR
jgi:CheY-like chemotaxis protein